jgi:phage tail sheath gpL-like
MTTISQPDVQFSIAPASTDISTSAQKVLLVAPKTSAGTAVSGALNESIGNDSSVYEALAGSRSLGYHAIRAFKSYNERTRLDAILLDDAAGTPATGTVVFGGAATEAGTLTIKIGSSKYHTITYAIADLDTPTLAGDSLAAAITADTRVPVTAANVTGTVTLTAANDGTEGNDITLEVSGTVAGLTVTLTGMASGATNPTLTGIFDVIGDARYQTIIWPATWGTTEIKALLDARFNAGKLIQDGMAIMAKQDSYANHITALGSENSQSVQYRTIGQIITATRKGSEILELSTCVAAQAAAIRALRFTENAPLSRFVIGSGRDIFGGMHMASKPLHNTPYPDLPVPPTGYGFDSTEIDALADAGGTVMGADPAGSGIIDNSVVTTYLTDGAGNSDPSFKYQESVDTMSQVREYFQVNVKARYAQERLTGGDIVAEHNMSNSGSIRAYIKRLHSNLTKTGAVLLQTSAEIEKYIDENLVITPNLTTGYVTVTMKVIPVSQIRGVTGSVQISFSVEG